jgi:shikimate dehydrogenase
LGWPLKHTLSPAIHNAAFRRLGLDWTYLAFPVPPERLSEAVGGLRALGGRGVNVTMPHKETVISLLDRLSDEAEAIGAVNTIEISGEEMIGHNTDVLGFTKFITGDTGADLTDCNALVLGAGGAARAVMQGLVGMGCSRIAVAARRPDSARSLIEMKTNGETIPWDEVERAVRDFDAVVNCTPVGMAGENLLPEAEFRPGQVVVDLIYQPPETPFLERARAGGADGWGGLGMLVHQAAASLEIWTGQQAPIEVMSAAAVHALGAGILRRDN